MHEVGEIDVGGEVLATGVLINLRSFEALLEQIGAERAMRAALIECVRGGAVVDGEHAAGFPLGEPFREPAVVGIVHLDRLAVRVVGGKPGRFR